ncbi:hypothetical protein HUE58_04860 [Candidatus Ruthia endofausta]|uniref:Uncharacterized protein n=1 Tax=Candidatus Ruthia endofausta TaxID=2738852 RepID=A0A6N0HQB8_9GAMM|nr:hypothetical protein [Candidatus Ruthia endofausta]QKQ24451.1 hypothetical protein HUE58_04860 [Candidatus Ruthia endofausta]
MSVKKIKVYPQINTMSIVGGKLDALTQEYENTKDLKTALEGWVNMIKKYDSVGYYPLVKPEFISEVLVGAFSNIKLTKKAVIADNNYQNISDYPQCNRVFQLPNEIKTQILKRLSGYFVSYQTDNWEILSVESIDNP